MAIEPTPDYTNAGTATYVPAEWNAGLLEALDPQLVFASDVVSNRNYEGDIRGRGDKVVINGIVTPEVGKYNDSTGMTIEQLSTVKQELDITEADYVAFYVGDIETVQAAGALSTPAVRRAIQNMAKSMDTFVGGVAANSATAYGEVDASALTSAPEKGEAILEAAFDMMQQLDENDVDTSGRWVVVSPRVKRYLVRAEAVANASAFGEGGVTRNGTVARLAGFTILSTTNMPSGVDMIAGQREFLTVAHQFEGFRQQPVEKFRRDQIDGLSLYGAKVVRFPELDATLSGNPNAFDETKATVGILKATVKTEADTSG